MFLKIYELDTNRFITASDLAQEAALKKVKVRLDL